MVKELWFLDIGIEKEEILFHLTCLFSDLEANAKWDLRDLPIEEMYEAKD